MTTKKGIAILGSTGSIGTQTLDVIESYPEKFEVSVLTANSNADLLIEQALKFKPNAVVIVDETKYTEYNFGKNFGLLFFFVLRKPHAFFSTSSTC